MRVAVLYGGTSAEADVSRKSGRAISAGLRKMGHSVEELDWTEKKALENIDVLRGFDVVFIGYHGGAGEDGRIQAAFEIAGIPFTGSGSLASALGMNKILTKYVFEMKEIPTAPWCTATRGEKIDEIAERISNSGFSIPVVVKPAQQGSTVGVTIVWSIEQLACGLEAAFRFGDNALIEKYIPGREVTVAILDDEPLPVVEIVPEGGFYDYEHKYTSGKSEYICPAEIDKETRVGLQDAAMSAYRSLGCRHYARVDFRLSEKGEMFCLEVNTLPGMTDLSLVPMAAREVGIDFPELVHRIAIMGASSKQEDK